MKKRTAILASCSVAAALLVAGIATATAQGGGSAASTAPTSIGPVPTPEQAEVLRAVEAGDPVGVVDREGTYRGTVDGGEQAARDQRILAQVVAGFREPTAPDDAEYERLWEALAILDPVVVSNAAGETVGYWVGHFVTPEESAASRATAEETVAELLRP